MIRSVLTRLAFAKYLFEPTAWRWLVHAMDYLVEDHLKPHSELNRAEPSIIHPTVSFRYASNIHVAAYTRLQRQCVLWASEGSEIRIGKHSGLGPGTMIFSSNHRFRPGDGPYHTQPWEERSVIVGENVWVGSGCILLPGTTVGSNSVVAAGAVVARDVAEGSVVGGVPAKVIG